LEVNHCDLRQAYAERKAAERTAALHDAGASKRALELAKLLDCACLFWRFWFGEIKWRSRIGSNGELTYTQIAIFLARNVDISTITV